jgi:hypothetical protein
MPYIKHYVSVEERRSKTGELKLLKLVWDDGKEYPIERSEYKGYDTGRSGAYGRKYVIWFKNRSLDNQCRDIFLEKDRFFVEIYKKPAVNHQQDYSDSFEFTDEDIRYHQDQ